MQPQQQYQPPVSPMQPAPVKKKRTISDIVTWAIVSLAVIVTLSTVAWAVIYFTGKTTSDTGKTQTGVAAVLEPAASAPMPKEVSSQLGVTIPYNARELEAFGFADDVTFSSSDLDEARPYTVMRIRPVETSEATRSEVTLESPELRVTSSASEAYWDKLASKKEYKDLSKVDMLVKQTVDTYEADRMVESSDAAVQEIGDVAYRKVTFTTTNELYGVTTKRYEDCYMTVQNDRPYVACINNIRASNFAAVPQLESVLSEVTYSTPVDEVLISETGEDAAAVVQKKETEDADVADAAEANEADENPNSAAVAVKDTASSSVPTYLASTSDFKSMAAAAPAVVRVGTVYCADIQLTLPSGSDGPALTGACVDKAGSGFFISRDGLIATSASSVQVKPQEAISAYITNAPNSSQVIERLERVLMYLVEAKVIMQTDADALIAGVEERDQDIIAKVNEISSRIESEDISITKEKYAYAAQIADKPIVVNQSGDGSNSFAYTDTVIEATIEAKSYSTDVTQDEIYAGKNVSSDTALLKLKKSSTYPALALGLSGEGVSEKSVANIVGMPMYAFGSLESAQFRETPMYRSGEISQTYNASEGQKTRAVAASSHAGLVGGPVLDRSRNVIGMATYNNLNCPERQCFANTVIRDTIGIEELVKQRNISLQSVSAASTVWDRAIDELIKGNYREATSLFESAGQVYPQNYLATRFAEYSRSQYGTATDTSMMNTVVSVLKALITTLLGLLILLLIVKIGLKIFTKPHTETQYGHMSQGTYINPAQWNTPPAAPVQTAAPLSTLPQPATWQPQQPIPSSQQPQYPQYSQPQTPAPQPGQDQPPQYPPRQQ